MQKVLYLLYLLYFLYFYRQLKTQSNRSEAVEAFDLSTSFDILTLIGNILNAPLWKLWNKSTVINLVFF